jgi:hypothetical protein
LTGLFQHVDLQNLIESRTDLESSESDSFIDEILSSNKQNSELKIEKQPVGKRKKKNLLLDFEELQFL